MVVFADVHDVRQLVAPKLLTGVLKQFTEVLHFLSQYCNANPEIITFWCQELSLQSDTAI